MSDLKPGDTQDSREPPSSEHRCGFVSFVGRPNVGKSSLVNQLVRQKISITSPVAQTTLRTIRAVHTTPDYQMIFVDTPGIHAPEMALGRRLNKSARDQASDSDVKVFVIEAQRGLTESDVSVLKLFDHSDQTLIAVANKIDRATRKQRAKSVSDLARVCKLVVETSAKTGEGIDALRESVQTLLPLGVALYDADTTETLSVESQIAEMVREQILLVTFEEVPHSVAVEVEEMHHRDDGLMIVGVMIYVERESQKGIVIGKGGARMKAVGQASRKSIEKLLGEHIYLDLRVKVRKDWRRSEDMIERFGYGS